MFFVPIFVLAIMLYTYSQHKPLIFPSATILNYSSKRHMFQSQTDRLQVFQYKSLKTT